MLSLRFTYHGIERLVDDATFIDHGDRTVLCGYEVLRGGLPSGRVKRYRLDSLREVQLIDPDGVMRLREEPRP